MQMIISLSIFSYAKDNILWYTSNSNCNYVRLRNMRKSLLASKTSRSQKKKISIVLADDHPLLRKSLRNILETEGDFEVIGEAADGKEALNLAIELSPDIVIMDISMPQMNGLDAIKEIKTRKSDITILVLTVHDETEYILGMLEAGASGYLTKGVFDKEVIHAIRAVIAGETVLSTEVSQNILRHALRHATKPVSIDAVEKLTTREIEILNLAGRGMKNRDIASELNLCLPTVKVYMSDIFYKLKVKSRTEAVMTGLRIGILDLDDKGNAI
jgi:NarL family two-component system response regulator LiaR